jgi:hypothetical protein
MLSILIRWGRDRGLPDEAANKGFIVRFKQGIKEDDMKRLMLFALLGGLALAAPGQEAQDNSVRIHGYQIALPSKPHMMLSGDFDTYKGGYDLSNGDILVMYQRGRHMYAQIGDREPKELVAAAPNIFVALDRELKVTLDRGPFGDFTGEVLMVAPSMSAQAEGGRLIRLVAAR